MYRECDLSCSLSKLNHTDRNDAGISPPSVSAGDTTLFIAAARPVSGRSAFLLSFKAATRHLDPSAISILLSSPRPPLCSGSHTTPFSPHERKKPVLLSLSLSSLGKYSCVPNVRGGGASCVSGTVCSHLFICGCENDPLLGSLLPFTPRPPVTRRVPVFVCNETKDANNHKSSRPPGPRAPRPPHSVTPPRLPACPLVSPQFYLCCTAS